MTDIERGEAVFKKFYSYWKLNPQAKLSYEEVLNTLKNRKQMGGNHFLDGLGMGVRESGMSDSRIDSAMKKLAHMSNAKLPERNGDFFAFLSNESTKINFVDAVAFTITQSSKDVLKGFESVGNSLITTGKIINFILPLIILIFLYYWLNKSTGGQYSRAIQGVKRRMK